MEETGRPERRVALCRSNLVFSSTLGFAIKESCGSKVCCYQFRQAALNCLRKKLFVVRAHWFITGNFCVEHQITDTNASGIGRTLFYSFFFGRTDFR